MKTITNRWKWCSSLALILMVMPAWAQERQLPAGLPAAAETTSMGDKQKDVESVVQAFATCWNRHDMEAFAQLFADDAEFVNVVGLWWKGREEIKRAHMATHATMFKSSHLVITKTAVRFLSADIALARASWELTGHTSPAGEAMPKRIGLLMYVLVRANAHWRIVDAQNTDIVEGVLAPPQAAQKPSDYR